MGWYVGRLLLDSEIIRESISQVYNYNDYPFYGEGLFEDDSDDELNQILIIDYDSDTYMDLLSVEMKISELYKNKVLKPDEIKILNAVMTNQPYSELEGELDLARRTISKKFKEICSKIAFYMGEHFTNDGYLTYMREKYNLSDEQIETLKNYME